MGVSSGRTRISDLAFQVFGRTLHPEWFSVHSHRRIVQDGWEADVRIVDGGHALLWSSGDGRLTEVLCGAETTLPEPGLLFHSPVRHERHATLRQGERAEYQTTFEVERLALEPFRHLAEELAADARRPDVLYHENRAANRLCPPSISCLRLFVKPWGLSVHAFHSFPEEQAIVRAQSLFEIPSLRGSRGA